MLLLAATAAPARTLPPDHPQSPPELVPLCAEIGSARTAAETDALFQRHHARAVADLALADTARSEADAEMRALARWVLRMKTWLKAEWGTTRPDTPRAAELKHWEGQLGDGEKRLSAVGEAWQKASWARYMASQLESGLRNCAQERMRALGAPTNPGR